MKKGLIYKLQSGNSIYIGSTERTMRERLLSGFHRAFTKYGFDYNDFTQEILEEVMFEDKNDLFRIEGEYMKKYNCVNEVLPKGYGKNKKEYDRNRYLNSNMKEQAALYYKNNKDKINERRRENHRFKREWGDLLSIKYDIFS